MIGISLGWVLMMSDVVKVVDREVSGWFYGIPIIITLLYLVVRFIVNYNIADTVLYKGFAWSFLILFLSSMGSAIVFWATAPKPKVPGERHFNGKEFCRDHIRRELLNDGLKISFFGTVQDSHRHTGYWGRDSDTKIYSEIVKVKGNMPSYMIVAMNMEEGHEDDTAYDHAPMNFSRENLLTLRETVCNRLAKKPELKKKYSEFNKDEFTGRTQSKTTEIPVTDDDELEE